jgi:acyl-coenzyme A synthetase/AMP-(fatty) acid ligase
MWIRSTSWAATRKLSTGAPIAMLACARIGAVHSVVFGGFAAAELATRIDDAAPKVMVSASCGIETNRIIEYKPILDRVSTDPEVLSAELVQLVRDQIGPVAALRRVDVIAALPKTRSGKILRKTMRGIADGRDEAVPSTIEDPAVLDALRPVLTDRD